MAAPSERTILFLVGAVQVINILDFMIVMPLGPDFARALDIPPSHLGVIGGSYTAAAAISGIATASFLDRFDRRKALAVAMAGLVVGTLLGGLATGLNSLVAARIVAGVFGGPATSISLSIVADVVPPERRGKAIGAVMGAFSVASVLGVPAALELARIGGWQTPFFVLAALGTIIAALGVFFLPSLVGHLSQSKASVDIGELLKRPAVWCALGAMASMMISNFLLIPNLSAFLQYNRGYPRDSLGLLYMAGGVVSFGVMRLGGILVDRFGPAVVGLVGTIVMVGDILAGLMRDDPWLPVLAFFVVYMISGSLRGVSMQTQASKVPAPTERAGYMSAQSAVQHMAAAVGAFLGSRLLTESPEHRLLGFPAVASLSIGVAALFPLMLFFVRRALDRELPAAPLVPEA